MSGSPFARAKEIFLAACSLPADRRAAYLREQCGDDPPLLAEVESLLLHHTAEEPLEAGSVFAGRYRIVSEVGRGGMGAVYRADDLILGEPVAIKLLPTVDEARAASLLNEVRTARRVTHPNVCRLYDYGQWEGRRYLTMELVEGENLERLLARIGRLPRDKAIDLGYQICSGLSAAHRGGILHRDLKPANIMIDERGRAKIMDFGIAARIGATEAPAGTPAYMAPEQRRRGEVTEQTDIYGLGLLLHEMITGESVFARPDPAKEDDPGSAAWPAVWRERLGPGLEALIRRCLAREPTRRPASITEVAASLPGDDRLRALVAEGITPSPDDLAAAAPQRAQAVEAHAFWPVLLVGLLAAFPWCSDLSLPGRARWSDPAPAVLVQRARELFSACGVEPRDADRAWGYHAGVGAFADGLFWYRQSPEPLLPSSVDDVLLAARVTFDDPPQLLPGMARLELASDGRLASLEIEPEDEDAPPSALDEAAFLALAGFDLAELRSVPPEILPPSFADRRLAWVFEGKSAERRLEAAWQAGRPVFFLDLRDAEEDGLPTPLEEWVERLAAIASSLFWVGLTGAAAYWARKHHRSRRGDPLAARRIAGTLVVASGLSWILSSRHVAEVDTELTRAVAALGFILVHAAVAWLVVVALEPFARRRWPQSLIALGLALRGRLASRLVARDLLVGTVFGSAWAILARLDLLIVDRLGLAALADVYATWQMDVALTLRSTLANALDSFVDAIDQGLLTLFCLAVLLHTLRRRWLAMALFVAVIGVLEAAEGAHPAVSWLTLGLGIGGLSLWILLRWGALALIATETVFFLLQTSPATLSWHAWYAETGGFALLAVLVTGLAAWWQARSGPSC